MLSARVLGVQQQLSAKKRTTKRMLSTQELTAFANAASSIGQAMIQLSNQLRDSATAHAHTQAQQRVAVAAAAPVPVPAAAALVEGDGIQRRIKFTEAANEVINVLNMLGVPVSTTRGMFGFAKSEQVMTKARVAHYKWDSSTKLAAVGRAKRWFEMNCMEDKLFIWPQQHYEAWQKAHGANLLAETGSSGSSMTSDANKKRPHVLLVDDGDEDYDAISSPPPPPPAQRASSASKLQPLGAAKFHQTRSASLEPASSGGGGADANSTQDASMATALPKPVPIDFEDADESVRILHVPRKMMRHYKDPNEWQFSVTADDVVTARFVPNPEYSITFGDKL
jgi:hypothetical protein